MILKSMELETFDVVINSVKKYPPTTAERIATVTKPIYKVTALFPMKTAVLFVQV